MEKQKSFLNAVKWSYAASWGERAFGALFAIILAVVLGPRDFGVISIAVIYINFLQMFLDQGFVVALIQKENLEPQHLDAVFWMDLVLSFFLVGVSILLSRWWATVNHAPQVATIISVLSLCIPIEGLAIVQRTLLSREMDFKSISIRSNVSVLVSGVIGIGMAFGGYGVWALVGQQITKDFVALILLWRLSSWRPRFEFSWPHLSDLMGFSISNFVAQLGIFADVQAGSILLALLLGPVALGIYRLAERLVNSVSAIATSSIQAVSLPEFSRLQSEPDKLRKSVLSCLRLSSTVTLPALAGLASVSGPLTAALGPKWVPASNVLKVLCALGIVLVFHFFTGPMLQALRKTREIVILEWGRTLVGIVCLLVAGFFVRHGSMNGQIMAIALARFVTGALIVTPIYLYILMQLSEISVHEVTAAVAPSAVASVAVVGAVSLFQYLGWLSNGRPLILLAAEIFIGGVIGLGVLLILDAQLRGVIARILQRTVGDVAMLQDP
jgi:O-antigen/teichoic acid export membrane protein